MFTAPSTKTISAKKDYKHSAFKTLLNELLLKNGDFSKINEKIRNSKIKCWVKETYPRFLVSDGSFFMSAYFTEDCYQKCHQGKEININLTDLNDGLILVTKWAVELTKVNSAEEFTSYGGLEMRLIIHEFKIREAEQMKLKKYPTNLYRDNDAKNLMLQYICDQRLPFVQKVVAANDKSLIELVADDKVHSGAPHNLRALNTLPLTGTSGDSDFTLYSFEDYNKTAIVSMREIFTREKG